MSNKSISARFNYIYSTSYSILNMILPLMTAPYISRVMGAEKLGLYSYSHSIANYFMLFAMLGINNFGSRKIAKVRNDQDELNKTFSNVYCMQLISATLMIILYALYIIFFVDDETLIYLIQGIFVIGVLVNVNWYFWGLEQFKVTVTRNLIIKGITFASIFILIKSPEDIWKYAAIMAVGSAGSEGILFFILRKYVKIVKPHIKIVVKMFKPNIILFIPILAVSVYRTMDKIMLKQFTDYAQVGFYTNSEKIITLGLSFITALGQVMMPKMTNILSRGDKATFYRLFEKSFKFSTAVSCAIAFGTLSIAVDFVPFFFGPGYEPCIIILSFLAPNLILLAWGNVLKTQLLIPLEKDTIYIKAVCFGAAINFVMNILLIPRIGAVGAVLGTLTAEFIGNLVILHNVKEEINILALLKSGIPYLIIGGIMTFTVYFLRSILANMNALFIIVSSVAVGGIVYVGLLLLYWKTVKEPLLLDTLSLIKRKLGH